MSKKILLSIGLTVIAALVLVILYNNATPQRILLTETAREYPAVTDPRFRRLLDNLLLTDITSGNSIELLKNGEEYFPAMLEAIAGAERSVTMETYEFFGDDVSAAFAEALAERAMNGVAVHFIADYVGSTKASASTWELMSDAGVEVVRWREPSWYSSSRFNHRTHRKLLVVDGNTAFTGGANLADPWAGSPSGGGYRDNHFRVRGPAVGYLQSAFMDNWLLAEGSVLLGEAYFPELGTYGDIDTQVVNSAPKEGRKRMRLLYLLAIHAARENLRISTAYFYADDMVMDALLEARARGVEIDILKPGDAVDDDWVRYASKTLWRELLEAGIRIHQYQPSVYHAKAIIVDDQWVTIGSANFDNRSFRINDETNLNVFNAGFAQQMIEQFDSDLENSLLFDLERWHQRSWWQRSVGRLANTVGPHL